MNDDPRGTIVAALVVTGGVLTWKGLTAGDLSVRTYAALVVVAFLLLVLGSFVPELAAALAVALAVMSILSGGDALAKLGNVKAR